MLYKPYMFLRTDRLTARIKVLYQNDWVWLEVALREQDIRYIEKHCKLDKIQSPKLKKQGKCWYLAFPFERNVSFADVLIKECLICAVDLGLNKNAVCSIMQSDGTVVARKFIDFSTEKDHLYKALGRQKKAQQHGNRKTPVLWKHVNDINREISRKTAKAIMGFAVLYNVDVIVFEHLDSNGKKRGRKKNNVWFYGANRKSNVLWNITLLTLPTAKAGGFLLRPLLHWLIPCDIAMSYTVSTS